MMRKTVDAPEIRHAYDIVSLPERIRYTNLAALPANITRLVFRQDADSQQRKKRSAARLCSLPEDQQQHIADKYHYGARPWLKYAPAENEKALSPTLAKA